MNKLKMEDIEAAVEIATPPSSRPLGKEGVVCSDSDLSAILSGQDLGDTVGGHRRSLTLVRKGLLVRGFLSHEMTTREEEFKRRRRVSTGSLVDPRFHAVVDQGGTSAGKQSSRSLCRRLSQADRERMVAWDDEKNFAVDPLLIGNVIEDYINKKSSSSPPANANQQQGKRFSLRNQILDSVKEQEYGPGSPLLQRRTRSVDAACMPKQKRAMKQLIVVDEASPPKHLRHLSLKSQVTRSCSGLLRTLSLTPQSSHTTVVQFEKNGVESKFAEMNV